MVELLADLIVFPLLKLDVILGMDWLTRHRAIVNCYTNEVIFEMPVGLNQNLPLKDKQRVLDQVRVAPVSENFGTKFL